MPHAGRELSTSLSPSRSAVSLELLNNSKLEVARQGVPEWGPGTTASTWLPREAPLLQVKFTMDLDGVQDSLK